MKLKYLGVGCEDSIFCFRFDDPRSFLITDQEYEVLEFKVYSDHCDVVLVDYSSLRLNSIWFDCDDNEEVKELIRQWRIKHLW